jgi:hypothetical protein
MKVVVVMAGRCDVQESLALGGVAVGVDHVCRCEMWWWWVSGGESRGRCDGEGRGWETETRKFARGRSWETKISRFGAERALSRPTLDHLHQQTSHQPTLAFCLQTKCRAQSSPEKFLPGQSRPALPSHAIVLGVRRYNSGVESQSGVSCVRALVPFPLVLALFLAARPFARLHRYLLQERISAASSQASRTIVRRALGPAWNARPEGARSATSSLHLLSTLSTICHVTTSARREPRASARYKKTHVESLRKRLRSRTFVGDAQPLYA